LAELTDRRQAEQFLLEAVPELGVRQFLLKNLIKYEHQLRWRFNLQGLIENYQEILAAPSAQGTYRNPVLFIKGGNSDYILPEHQPIILSKFPNAKAKIIQGAGHWLHAEKPAAFTKIVRDFLLR